MNLAETRSHKPLVNKPKVKKAAKPIRKIGKKMSALKREYMRLREKFLNDHPYCWWYLLENGLQESDIHPCGFVNWGHPREGYYPLKSTEVHHKKGRGMFLLDTSTWMPVCSEAHRIIHANTKLSYERGYMQPRR